MTPKSKIASRSMDEMVELATALAEGDERMLFLLVQARKDAGLSQRDVADALGIKQSSVAAFERRGNDPRLSTIRRYALAVDAAVRHEVSCPLWPGGTWRASHDLNFGLHYTEAQLQKAVAAPHNSRRSDFATAA